MQNYLALLISKIAENHAYDHRRLTLVRYESLALTKAEYKLTMMTTLDAPGSNRISKTEVDEYTVTSQVSWKIAYYYVRSVECLNTSCQWQLILIFP